MSGSPGVNYTFSERIATACIGGIFFGLILPKVLRRSGDEAILLWLIFSVFYGLVIGSGKNLVIKKLVFYSIPPAVLGPLTFVSLYIIKNLIQWVRTGSVPTFRIAVGYGNEESIAFNSSRELHALGGILIFTFIATIIVTVCSAIAQRMLVFGISHVFKFGPQGLERIKNIFLAFGGLASVVFAMWIAF